MRTFKCFVVRLHVDPNIIIVETLHCHANEVFQFICHVSFSCVSKFIHSQYGLTLKLMRYELNNYKNEERLGERIERCQKFMELNGNMVDVVYMDEGCFDLHLTQ